MAENTHDVIQLTPARGVKKLEVKKEVNDDDEQKLHRTARNVNWDEPTEDYYVHIDVLKGCPKSILPQVARRINSHMKKAYSVDPRRECHVSTGDMATPTQRKSGGDCYYEFWKVSKEFWMNDFRGMVRQLPPGVQVRITRILNNQHKIDIYESSPLTDVTTGVYKSNAATPDIRRYFPAKYTPGRLDKENIR